MRRQACLLLSVLLVTVAEPGLFASDLFTLKIAPLLERHCLACHSGQEPDGELSLESSDGLTAAGVVIAGQASQSRLIELLTPRNGVAEMPREAPPLMAEELDALREWIDQGAIWPPELHLRPRQVRSFDWWSYQPLKRPSVPLQAGDWPQNPIDHFLLAKQNELGLHPVPLADRHTLMRRVSYDLTGLPPSPEEVANFVNSPAPNAYEQLVDRLLESPAYGERWASHWLDVVKYADTHGYDKDKLRMHAWPYRDYVIRSLNQDKPYGRFLQEQIAGDILFPGDPEGVLGLGFLAAGPWDFIGHVEVSESKIDGKVARNLDRDDMVANTFNTFCSVTVQCARCHDHKFDPIRQQDYYGLQAVFAAVDRANRVYQADSEIECARAAIAQQIQSLEQTLSGGSQGRQGHASEVEQGTSQLSELKSLLASLPAPKLVYAAATDFSPEGSFLPTRGIARAIYTLRRGNVTQPLTPALPAMLPLREGESTGLRLDLAEGERRAILAKWLAAPENPFVWRSIVNRLWQYHFGTGLVDSPNDFGRMGDTPSHPELLDWLAVEFRDGGQSFKAMHRLIVTSRAYQLAAMDDPANAAVDAANRFLWRGNRRRLDAEEIRDSILAVSGELDRTMGGPGDFLFVLDKTEHSPHFEYEQFDPAHATRHRRSIYRFVVRSQPDPWMTTLDCADHSQSTPKRNETLTSLQALSLLNHPFCLHMAKRLAHRVANESPTLATQVIRAVQLVLQRVPTEHEQAVLYAYAEQHGLDNLCRVLFNLNEFVFVD